MSRKKTLLIALAILVIGVGVTVVIFMTEPSAQRTGATKKTAMLVKVEEVEFGDYRPRIIATGNVQPARDITLSPRVSGQIISVSHNFVPGATLPKGTELLQIDPADFRNALALRESELEQAKSDLAVERGLQEVAQKDYTLVDDVVETENTDLVLRKPQLNAVKARLQAARANVQQARLNLQRTTIRTPFDAQVLRRNANVGSQVAPGNNLGRLVGSNEYWVVLTVPLRKLPWIKLPEGNGSSGAAVIIRDKKSWQAQEFREGQVVQLVGSLDDNTRLARLLVSVKNHLGQNHDSLPRLIINSFVEAEIQARPVNNVVRLNRDYIREGNTVWVMEQGKLNIRSIDILFSDQKFAYCAKGLEEGDKVVTTNLATVAEGALLRTAADSVQTSQSPAQ